MSDNPDLTQELKDAKEELLALAKMAQPLGHAWIETLTGKGLDAMRTTIARHSHDAQLNGDGVALVTALFACMDIHNHLQSMHSFTAKDKEQHLLALAAESVITAWSHLQTAAQIVGHPYAHLAVYVTGNARKAAGVKVTVAWEERLDTGRGGDG